MDKFSGQKRAAQFLFPSIDPFESVMLDTGDGHEIYVERCGNPNGKPVIVLHGGPGGGCSPVMRRYFDPSKYHIILFDHVDVDVLNHKLQSKTIQPGIL